MKKLTILALLALVIPSAAFAQTATVYKRNAHQLISASSWTKLTFDTAEHDPSNMFDNTNDRFVIPSGCTTAQFEAQVWFGGNSTTARGIKIRKNGSDAYPGAANLDWYSTGTATASAGVSSPVLSVSEGDYFEVYVWTATNKWTWGFAVDTDVGNNWFSIHCI